MMPLQQTNLNYAQLKLGEEFEIPEEEGITPEEAARRSEAAKAALTLLIQDRREGATRYASAGLRAPEEEELPAWLETFLGLLEKNWPWRQAAYIAWAASPRQGRWPETQEELATKVLGLTSDRVIATWRAKNPAIETMVATLQAAPLFEHRADAIRALVKSATNEDYKHHQDRKLYFEMIGDYVPVTQLKALLASGKLQIGNKPDELPYEKLLELVGSDEVLKAEFAPWLEAEKELDAGATHASTLEDGGEE